MATTPGIMITNGGPHPADRWSAVSASQIVDLIEIDEASQSKEAVAARRAKPRFEMDLADALETHHATIQNNERAGHDEGHMDTLEEAVAAVEEAAVGTPFEKHFAEPHVLDVVRQIVGGHMATIVDIEQRTRA